MNILVFNAGNVSLRFEVTTAEPDITNPTQEHKQASGMIEGIGNHAILSQRQDKQVIHQPSVDACNYRETTQRALEWLDSKQQKFSATEINPVGHRVVHGENQFLVQ
jgi:acetate kinase